MKDIDPFFPEQYYCKICLKSTSDIITRTTVIHHTDPELKYSSSSLVDTSVYCAQCNTFLWLFYTIAREKGVEKSILLPLKITNTTVNLIECLFNHLIIENTLYQNYKSEETSDIVDFVSVNVFCEYCKANIISFQTLTSPWTGRYKLIAESLFSDDSPEFFYIIDLLSLPSLQVSIPLFKKHEVSILSSPFIFL